VFLKRITGTGNIQVTLDGSTYSTVELSDTLWYRIVLSGSVTNPTVGIRLAVSGDAVAMDYGQVEDGLFVTSPILTTTATVTRSADVGTLFAQNFGNNVRGYNKGTFYGAFTPFYSAVTPNGSDTGLSMRDSVGNGNLNNLGFRNVGNANFQLNCIAGGAGTSPAVASPLGNIKAAVSFQGGTVNGAASSEHGTNSIATTLLGSSQPLINSFVLSAQNTGSSGLMWVKRATFYPTYTNVDSLRTLVNSL
jgi:hypothetical protein